MLILPSGGGGDEKVEETNLAQCASSEYSADFSAFNSERR